MKLSDKYKFDPDMAKIRENKSLRKSREEKFIKKIQQTTNEVKKTEIADDGTYR